MAGRDEVMGEGNPLERASGPVHGGASGAVDNAAVHGEGGPLQLDLVGCYREHFLENRSRMTRASAGGQFSARVSDRRQEAAQTDGYEIAAREGS
ncbi:hypothetical protein MYXO_01938 [Myxococcaceae bacterium]|jgi:hypothetical protein|nr:hypothetical protein MYXO_01938 [Myxococcaceae bacterium]